MAKLAGSTMLYRQREPRHKDWSQSFGLHNWYKKTQPLLLAAGENMKVKRPALLLLLSYAGKTKQKKMLGKNNLLKKSIFTKAQLYEAIVLCGLNFIKIKIYSFFVLFLCIFRQSSWRRILLFLAEKFCCFLCSTKQRQRTSKKKTAQKCLKWQKFLNPLRLKDWNKIKLIKKKCFQQKNQKLFCKIIKIHKEAEIL